MEQLNAAMERIAADPDLVARLQDAASTDERRECLRDAGIEITDDLRQQAQSISRKLNIDINDPESLKAVELSDDELSQLTGGGGLNIPQITAGAGGGAVSALVSISLSSLAW